MSQPAARAFYQGYQAKGPAAASPRAETAALAQFVSRFGLARGRVLEMVLDPHEVLLFFLSRGWTSPSHPTLGARFLARHGAIVVRKP